MTLNNKLAFALTCCALSASASTITFGSGVPGTFEGNTTNSTNVPTIPASAWASPIGTSIWESTQTDSTNPAIPNGTLTDFWVRLNILGTPTGGGFWLLVDDEANVEINNTSIGNNIGVAQGPPCGSTTPNCVTPAYYDISPYLSSGLNYIDVQVYQQADAQMGFDLYGSVSYDDPAQTPEPSTLAGVGIGFIVLSLGSRKLRRNAR